jgi:Ca2+-binding EF-hand superfamily protein
MNKFKVAQQYVETTKQHQNMEQKLHEAVQILDQDNQLNIYGPVHKAYDELVSNILGDNLVEHLLVWIYELDFGKLDTRTFKEFFYSHKDAY